MEHYEVRDAFRRLTTPALFVKLSFVDGERHSLEFSERDDLSKPFNLIASMDNQSNQPASHAIVEIGVAAELEVISRGAMSGLTKRTMYSGRLNYKAWKADMWPGRQASSR
jgi:hypothetical protein